MKAAVYGRNSKPPKGWKPSFEGEEAPGSWTVQVPRCEAAALAAGDELVVSLHDVASGGNANRPAWSRLMGMVRGGVVGRVYVTKLDRCARNLRHFLDTAEAFEARGAELVVLDQQAASVRKQDPAGKAFRNMMATFAELELDLIRERSGAVMTIGPDGRVYGPRSDQPAGRPREFGAGHKLRLRGGKAVHDKARCQACGEKGGVAASVSDPSPNAGVAEPVGFATPERAVPAAVVAGVNRPEPAAPGGNEEVAKGQGGA